MTRILLLTVSVLGLGTGALAQDRAAGTSMGAFESTPMSAFERNAIADLEGTIVAFPNFAASGFPALPAGQHYGIKDHRLVVVDDRSGVILRLVQVVSTLDDV